MPKRTKRNETPAHHKHFNITKFSQGPLKKISHSCPIFICARSRRESIKFNQSITVIGDRICETIVCCFFPLPSSDSDVFRISRNRRRMIMQMKGREKKKRSFCVMVICLFLSQPSELDRIV